MGAVNTKVKILNAVSSEEHIFCSYVVAKAYLSAGLDICGEKKPANITPADIEKSPLFENITESLLIKAQFDLKTGSHFFLDGKSHVSRGEDIAALRIVAKKISKFLTSKGYQGIDSFDEQHMTRQGFTPSNPFIKALNYVRERRLGLEVFLTDPDVPIDTNHLERALRVIPMGRNYPRFLIMEGLDCGVAQNRYFSSSVSGHVH